MTDRGAQRTFDVFFYGLHLDPAILARKAPRHGNPGPPSAGGAGQAGQYVSIEAGARVFPVSAASTSATRSSSS